ncbi:hypothetical protein AGLY_001305, partial [Aphis glycines]
MVLQHLTGFLIHKYLIYHNSLGSNPSLTIFNSTAPLGTPNWIILRYFNIVGSTVGSLVHSITVGSDIFSSVLLCLSVVLVLIMNYLLIDVQEVHLFAFEVAGVLELSYTLVSNIHRDAEIFCKRCSDFIIFASQCVMKLFKNVTVDFCDKRFDFNHYIYRLSQCFSTLLLFSVATPKINIEY